MIFPAIHFQVIQAFQVRQVQAVFHLTDTRKLTMEGGKIHDLL